MKFESLSTSERCEVLKKVKSINFLLNSSDVLEKVKLGRYLVGIVIWIYAVYYASKVFNSRTAENE